MSQETLWCVTHRAWPHTSLPWTLKSSIIYCYKIKGDWSWIFAWRFERISFWYRRKTYAPDNEAAKESKEKSANSERIGSIPRNSKIFIFKPKLSGGKWQPRWFSLKNNNFRKIKIFSEFSLAKESEYEESHGQDNDDVINEDRFWTSESEQIENASWKLDRKLGRFSLKRNKIQNYIAQIDKDCWKWFLFV